MSQMKPPLGGCHRQHTDNSSKLHHLRRSRLIDIVIAFLLIIVAAVCFSIIEKRHDSDWWCRCDLDRRHSSGNNQFCPWEMASTTQVMTGEQI
jgi:hypothetical protein